MNACTEDIPFHPGAAKALIEMTEKSRTELTIDRLSAVIAVGMSCYQLLAANFTIFSAEQHINLWL